MSLESPLDAVDISLGENTLTNYIVLAVLAIILYFIFRIIVSGIIRKLRKTAKRTKTDFDDFIVEILNILKWPAFILIVLVSIFLILNVNDTVKKIINYFLIIFVTYEAILVVLRFVDYGATKMMSKENQTEMKEYLPMFIKIVKVLVWAIGCLLILSNLGYNVSSLVAGLGIGGIAIALAVQNILGDLFSSLSIYFDKPFKIGDFVVIGDQMGTVKSVGMKTTRITTLKGEELIVPNRKLTDSEIHNYGKMEKRRVVFNFGVTYNTPHTKLQKIPAMVKKIFLSITKIDLGRVHFFEFGESSLNFEVVYYVTTNNYGIYMDKQQKVNLEIMKAFEKEGIEFAYPTQTVYVKQCTSSPSPTPNN